MRTSSATRRCVASEWASSMCDAQRPCRMCISRLRGPVARSARVGCRFAGIMHVPTVTCTPEAECAGRLEGCTCEWRCDAQRGCAGPIGHAVRRARIRARGVLRLNRPRGAAAAALRGRPAILHHLRTPHMPCSSTRAGRQPAGGEAAPCEAANTRAQSTAVAAAAPDPRI
jgi:hypothetical protein